MLLGRTKTRPISCVCDPYCGVLTFFWDLIPVLASTSQMSQLDVWPRLFLPRVPYRNATMAILSPANVVTRRP